MLFCEAWLCYMHNRCSLMMSACCVLLRMQLGVRWQLQLMQHWWKGYKKCKEINRKQSQVINCFFGCAYASLSQRCILAGEAS